MHKTEKEDSSTEVKTKKAICAFKLIKGFSPKFQEEYWVQETYEEV